MPYNGATLSGTDPDFQNPGSSLLMKTPTHILITPFQGFPETLGSTACPVLIDGAGTIQSPASFQEWVHRQPTASTSTSHTTWFSPTKANGVYGINAQSFYPIDGQGFGTVLPDGTGVREQKLQFTLQLQYQFTYTGNQSCGRSALDDDMYVYINDTLALNLGGIHGESRRNRLR